MLATKEANEKARNSAYALLISIGDVALKNQESLCAEVYVIVGLYRFVTGGQVSSQPFTLTDYISIVMAGLAGTQPHMISAAVISLARLAYEVATTISLPHVIIRIAVPHARSGGPHPESV